MESLDLQEVVERIAAYARSAHDETMLRIWISQKESILISRSPVGCHIQFTLLDHPERCASIVTVASNRKLNHSSVPLPFALAGTAYLSFQVVIPSEFRDFDSSILDLLRGAGTGTTYRLQMIGPSSEGFSIDTTI